MKTRTERLSDEFAAALRKGAFGAPGFPFLSARQLAARCGISLESACRVMASLSARRMIRLDGKHYYITTGFVSSDTPYGTRLAAARRPILGMILNSMSSPFFSALAKELSDVSAKSGYTLLIADSGNLPARERELMDRFLSDGACGLFVSPSIPPDPDLFSFCPLPIVTLGRDLQLKNCDAITVDNYTAGQQVAKHLLDVGCRRFAYIGIRRYLTEDPRLHGFSDQLRDRRAALRGEDILAADYLPDDGLDYESLSGGIQSLLYRLPEGEKLGVFCYHDLLASFALQKIKHISHRASGRFRIPEDVAIVGFDDLPLASVIVPALTTVQYPYASIAREAMECMLDYIGRPDHLPRKHEIGSSLCIRGSSL